LGVNSPFLTNKTLYYGKEKTLLELAQYNDFEQDFEYFDYIVDSWISGQKQQVLSLYKDMQKGDRNDFVTNHLDETNQIYASEIKSYLLTNI